MEEQIKWDQGDTEPKEDFIIRSILIYALHKVLLWWLNKNRDVGRDM
jgi:hypothetical protein